MKEKAVSRIFDQNCHLVGLSRQAGRTSREWICSVHEFEFSADFSVLQQRK